MSVKGESLEDFYAEFDKKPQQNAELKESHGAVSFKTRVEGIPRDTHEKKVALEKRISETSLTKTSGIIKKSPRVSITERRIQTPKAPRKRKPATIQYRIIGDIDEIIRLKQTIDEQGMTIASVTKEMRILKIMNQRQQKAIEQSDKDQTDLPRVLKAMNETLRVAKSEKLKYQERANALDRSSASLSDEVRRLHDRISAMKEKIKNYESLDLQGLRDQLNKANAELDTKTLMIETLQKAIRQAQSERDREISFSKQKIGKLVRQVEMYREEVEELNKRLKDKEKQVSTMSMYTSTYTAHHVKEFKEKEDNTSFLSSPSPKKQMASTSSAMSPPPKSDANVSASVYPIVEVSLSTLQSIKSNEAIKSKPNLTLTAAQPAPTAQKPNIHKPNMFAKPATKTYEYVPSSVSDSGKKPRILPVESPEVKKYEYDFGDDIPEVSIQEILDQKTQSKLDEIAQRNRNNY